MALNEKTISSQIYNFMKQSSQTTQKDPDKAMKDFSDNLAGIIVKAIKSATVNPGIPVTVAGPLAGSTTGPGTLS